MLQTSFALIVNQRSIENEKETEKATTNTKSLKRVPFRKETGEKKL